jgi:hypothetical protein
LVETWLGTIGMIPERFAFEAQCPLPGLEPRGFSGNRG